MIEIQCSSCHTRYRIDERVLPAESPTFKCSRCGHVFTTDPLTAKKISPESSSKPSASRVSVPRSEAKPRATPAPAAVPSPISPDEALSADSSELQSATASSASAAGSKPAPLKPYIRNPRPTVFDRTPQPPPSKPAPEPAASVVDSEAVARMQAAVQAPRLTATGEPEQPKKEPARTLPEPSRGAKNNQLDDEGENLEFDFSDERAPELGPESSDDDALASPQRWSVGDNDFAPPAKRQSGFGSEGLDPEFSRGEPAPIGRGTIPQYAAIAPIQPSEPLPDERAFVERAGLHSARSFLGLFLVTAMLFLIATGVIHGIPSASADLMRRMPVIGEEFVQPVALESLLSIADVQSSYQTVKGGHQALVVGGVVKNNSAASFHTVQIAARLLDAAQHDLASSAVYCGSSLSPRMIGEMTPHELEFLQQLEPPKAFILEPGHSAPFLMVLIDPPGNLSHCALTVTKALPPGAPSSAQQAGARP